MFGQYVIAKLSASTQVRVATPQIPVRRFHCLESGFKTLLVSLMLCHRSPHSDCASSSVTVVIFPDCAPSSAIVVTFPDCATVVFINNRSFPNFTAASVTIHIFPDCTPSSVTLRTFPECIQPSSVIDHFQFHSNFLHRSTIS